MSTFSINHPPDVFWISCEDKCDMLGSHMSIIFGIASMTYQCEILGHLLNVLEGKSHDRSGRKKTCKKFGSSLARIDKGLELRKQTSYLVGRLRKLRGARTGVHNE